VEKVKKVLKSKNQKREKKPVCEKCDPVIQTYINLSLNDDEALGLLSDLLIVGNPSDLSERNVGEIGYTISAYLQRKLLREATLFGRSKKRLQLEEFEVKGELARIKAYRQQYKK